MMQKKFIYLLLFYISCYCLSYAVLSSFLPDIGDSDRSKLSYIEANYIGKQVIINIQNQKSMVDDYDIIAYLNDLGNNLVSYSSAMGEKFNFYLIKDKDINAFALPGGYICVNNGLIYYTQSEAELTAVLSHEIGHIAQHHIFRNIANIQREQWKTVAGILAGALVAAANPAAGILAITGVQSLSMQDMLSFSRDFEREADRIGQKIMFNAGFDPHAMEGFFQKLYDTNKFNDNEALAFLRSHPVTSERIAEAEQRANQYNAKMRADSNTFYLIREKVRVRQLGVNDAMKFYEQALKFKRYTSLSAQYYGMAFASFSDMKYSDGLKYLSNITDISYNSHPAVISLKAQILSAIGNYKDADAIFSKWLENYPNYKSLWLGKADLLLKQKKYIELSNYLDLLTRTHTDDLDLWQRYLMINSDSILNNQQKYYYALGNQQFLTDNYKQAADSYLSALNVKKNDPLLNDIIHSKLIQAQDLINVVKNFSS